jgi:predicted lipoprotein with Yx(FWY)xxD motif
MRVLAGRTRVLAVAVILAAALLAACGKSTTAGSGSGGTGAYGGGGTSASPATGSGTIGAASISGVGTVLTDANGMTVYHLTTEKNGAIQCTGSCATTWPPLLASGGTAPQAGSGVTGKLGTITRPDGGVQVTYNGMPLYTYSGDKTAGQANGQGISNVWYAVTASGKSSGSGSHTGGGYGGY